MARQNTIEKLIQQIQASNAYSRKVAMEPEVPQEGHPTDKFDDRAEVPEGPEIEESSKEQEDQFGDLSAGKDGKVNPVEDEPEYPGSENLHHGGDDADPRLKPEAGIDDPGPDSDHPASPNNVDHKYASIDDPVKLAEALQEDLQRIMLRVTKEMSAGGKKEASDEKGTDDKIASALKNLLKDDEDKKEAVDSVASILEPCVAYGIETAMKVAAYLDVALEQKIAEEEEAAAEAAAEAESGGAGVDAEIEELASAIEEEIAQQAALTGIPEEILMEQAIAELVGGEGEVEKEAMAPGMMDGVDPSMMGGVDPSMVGGDEDPETEALADEIEDAIEQQAAQLGVPPEVLMEEVISDLLEGEEGGEMPAGEAAMAGGEPPKEAGYPVSSQEYAQALQMLQNAGYSKTAAAPLVAPGHGHHQPTTKSRRARQKLAELLLEEARKAQLR